MTTTNKRMKGEQLDKLMTIAVSIERDSGKTDKCPVSMFFLCDSSSYSLNP